MATKNTALWLSNTVGPQGPMGPAGPQGPAGPAAGLTDTWWTPLLYPAPGATFYARVVSEGQIVQLCGQFVSPVWLQNGEIAWCGYLPPGCEVVGSHFIPCMAYGDLGFTCAGFRINFDAAQVVAVEGWSYSQQIYFYAGVISIPKNGPGGW